MDGYVLSVTRNIRKHRAMEEDNSKKITVKLMNWEHTYELAPEDDELVISLDAIMIEEEFIDTIKHILSNKGS